MGDEQRLIRAAGNVSVGQSVYDVRGSVGSLPMTLYKTLLFSLVAGLMLAACANPGSFVPQQSTITDVRARMGSPTDIRFDQNGNELWEYATGPRGRETYLFRFGKDGKVTAVTQLLTEEQFGKIAPNQTTKAGVRDLLGRPSDEAFVRDGTSWSWHVRTGDRDGRFVVRFRPDGVVLEKAVIHDGGRAGGTGGNGGLLGTTPMK